MEVILGLNLTGGNEVHVKLKDLNASLVYVPSGWNYVGLDKDNVEVFDVDNEDFSPGDFFIMRLYGSSIENETITLSELGDASLNDDVSAILNNNVNHVFPNVYKRDFKAYVASVKAGSFMFSFKLKVGGDLTNKVTFPFVLYKIEDSYYALASPVLLWKEDESSNVDFYFSPFLPSPEGSLIGEAYVVLIVEEGNYDVSADVTYVEGSPTWRKGDARSFRFSIIESEGVRYIPTSDVSEDKSVLVDAKTSKLLDLALGKCNTYFVPLPRGVNEGNEVLSVVI